MLPSVIDIRNRYLSNDGIIIPRRAFIFLAGFEDKYEKESSQNEDLDVPNNSGVRVAFLDPTSIVTPSAEILDLDLKTLEMPENKFSSEFELKAWRDCTLNGLVSWFDTEMIEGLTLTTSPYKQQTHWKQTCFYLEQGFVLTKDDIVKGKLHSTQQPTNYRALIITIEMTEVKSGKSVKKDFSLF